MDLDWEETLINIFCGYINQSSLEEGAESMVFASEQNPTIHRKFLNAFDQGIRMATNEDNKILEIFSRSSSYTANSFDDAMHLLKITRDIYMNTYGKEAGT